MLTFSRLQLLAALTITMFSALDAQANGDFRREHVFGRNRRVGGRDSPSNEFTSRPGPPATTPAPGVTPTVGPWRTGTQPTKQIDPQNGSRDKPSKDPSPNDPPGNPGPSHPSGDPARQRNSVQGNCYLGYSKAYDRPDCFWYNCYGYCQWLGALGKTVEFNSWVYEKNVYLGFNQKRSSAFWDVCKSNCKYY